MTAPADVGVENDWHGLDATPARPAKINGHHHDPVDEPEQPTHDTTAERAVLGACLLEPDVIPDIDAIIRDDDFYDRKHLTIWHALIDLAATGQHADELTVWNHLQHDQHFLRNGGALYLHGLVEAVPTISNATYYARIVADRGQARRWGSLATWVAQAAGSGLDDDEIRAKVEKHLQTKPPGAGQASSWQRVDLGPILAGNADIAPRPTLLTRRDGAHLLYPGYVHSVSGEPGSGKSWLADIGVLQQIALGNDIAYFDFEDRAESLAQRLRDLGADDQAIERHVRYIRPTEALGTATKVHAEHEARGTTLVIVDGITEAMTLHGLSLMDNEDVARWLDLIPRALADLGPAVLQIDHVVKNSEARGRYAIGGQHKLAGINGAAYKMVTVHSFGREVKGKARLIVDKDRHGYVGPNGATVAELTLDATDSTGRLFAWLDTAGGDHAEDGSWRPTGFMEKVSRWLELNPGASRRDIEAAIKGRREHIRTAIQTLLIEGHLRTEDGPKNSVLHYVETPFREDD